MPEAENNQLSDREQEILKLVATGVTNKEIAKQLFISVNTVKVHLRNIFAKLDVSSRTEATIYAVQRGLVQPHLGAQEGEFSSAYQSEGSIDATTRWWQRPWFVGILGILVIVGGVVGITLAQQGPSDSGTSLILPQPAQQERWGRLADMPTSRMGHALAVYEDQIYAIGGQAQEGLVVNTVEIYDPETDAWTQRSSKPTPVTDVQADVIGGLIYVPGGRLPEGASTDILEVYNPREDVWEKRASLPRPISAYALTAYEGSLYLFGGWDGEEYLDTTFAYDPNNDRWTELTPMPTKRAHAGAAEAGGKIFVIGGFDGDQPLRVSEAYVPEIDDGIRSPWSVEQPLPNGRYAMGMASVADIIHIVGGVRVDENEPLTVEYFPFRNEWQQFESPELESWSYLGLVSMGAHLYAIGGKQDADLTEINLAYQAIFTISFPVAK
jgi:DNA-binding CsgD family transcriptional regulator